jgi:LPS-assembly lipoprotein
MNRRRMTLGLTLLANALIVSGCGFQLQGQPELIPELESVYLEVPNRSSDLARELKRSLQVSDVRIVNRPEEATAVIELMRDRSGREVESVSAENRPREYRVFYSATYRVKAGETVLLRPQQVTRTRIYTYDELDVLAKDHEETLLRGALAREIAGVIARRLATIEVPVTTS